MSFESEVRDFVIKANGLQEKQVRYLCLDLFKNVVQGTPVDTGRARANWQATINTPATGSTEDTDKQGGATISAASNAVSQAVGNVFYITNNLPYIYRLEFDGWSKQAPSGWVRTAIERTKQIAAKMPRS
ncbi:hypothetical protein SXAG_00154 [Synechococcus phage S-CBS4]|nr:hypothetical protein SXAG_00154 [Synechococcus phage S-CBS4]